MIDYDATDTDIQIMQDELLKYGITKEMCDLSRYVGATYREIRSIQKAVIERHKKFLILKEGVEK